ncbi:MAG: VOC family protein [Myxococcota bacterium]|nr:VOC family protein [Myxococcota bacterium]
MFQGIDHYVIFVTDLAASRAWYERLGLLYAHGGEHGHFFSLPAGGLLMLHPAKDGPAGSIPQLYLSVGDVHAALTQHRQAGMEAFSENGSGALPAQTPWGSTEYNLRDPDGHVWGIVQARGGATPSE